MKYIQLRNGVSMPMLGYGTFQISSLEAKNCVQMAIEKGYRLIDTASSYFNEEAIGQAIIDSKVAREELFITTKVWVQDSGYEKTLKAFEHSLHQLKLDYIDLYLIHQPYGDYYGSYRALEELYRQKKVRAIGVSNFSPERFVDLCMNVSIMPMVNQIEIHPFLIQEDFIDLMKQYGCRAQAWGPFNEGQRDIFTNEILDRIAKHYHKSIAQVILRWHYQRGVITIPKTISTERMAENMNIWDFKLTQEDMKTISQMDIGYSEIINHQSYKTALLLNKYKIHEEEENENL